MSKDEKFRIGNYVIVGFVLLILYLLLSDYTVDHSKKLLASNSILTRIFGYSKIPEFKFKRPLYVEERAIEGDTKAMIALARLLLSGTYYWANNFPLEQYDSRFIKAETWLKKAATKGNAEAMYLIACIYDENNPEEYQHMSDPLFREVNADLARKWYEKASMFGYNRANLMLSKMYANRSYAWVNSNKALYYLEKYIEKNPPLPSGNYLENNENFEICCSLADYAFKTNQINSTIFTNLSNWLAAFVKTDYFHLQTDEAYLKLKLLASKGSKSSAKRVDQLSKYYYRKIYYEIKGNSNGEPGDFDFKLAEYIVKNGINYEIYSFDTKEVSPIHLNDAKKHYKLAKEKNYPNANLALNSLLFIAGTKTEREAALDFFTNGINKKELECAPNKYYAVYRKIEDVIGSPEKRGELQADKSLNFVELSFKSYKQIDFDSSKKYFLLANRIYNHSIRELDVSNPKVKFSLLWFAFVYESGFFGIQDYVKAEKTYSYTCSYGPTFYKDYYYIDRSFLKNDVVSLKNRQPEINLIKAIRLKAIKGDHLSMFQNGLSYLYEDLRFTDGPKEEGVYWIDLAAKAGYLPAQIFIIRNQDLFEPSYYDDFLYKLASQGIPHAMTNYGIRRERGSDLEEARTYSDTLVIKAAESGCIEAIEAWKNVRFYDFYYNKEQFEFIKSMLLKAENNGNDYTLMYLSELYNEGKLRFKDNIIKEPANKLLKKAAEKNNPHAMLLLGIKSSNKKDYKSAYIWFNKLKAYCDKNGYSSSLDIWYFRYGANVVDRIISEMKVLGIQGKNNAQDQLAINNNLTKLQIKAKNGDVNTTYLLAEIYYKGIFVQSDKNEQITRDWLNKAKEAGFGAGFKSVRHYLTGLLDDPPGAKVFGIEISRTWNVPEDTNVYEESLYYVKAAQLKCKNPPPIYEKPSS